MMVAEIAFAHYIFHSLIAGNTTSVGAVRQPQNYDPVEIENVTSTVMTCNVNPTPAIQTVSVPAGSTLGFNVLSESDNQIFHQGPAAVYLGMAPVPAASWNGSGANCSKIAEWGATFTPLVNFTDFGATQLTTTIPAATPSGEYLARIEQIGLHIPGAPQWYISCAQIKITGGGSGNPSKVSIPGYVNASDPSLTLSIYDPIPTSYTVPGPAVWRG
ncbi:putative glycoside hydrolase family 61 protein [Lyophyllum shimeji]|uniref:AA9 family lytic polysaccharide monooxygenase n=1 Tax=Lyophyllum shimeji TaxID=47721 RepID=A0A9P3PR72_LYOSH|nr:putative glycoside hydrolase family 61 protein [Lyophyllum shimeji]